MYNLSIRLNTEIQPMKYWKKDTSRQPNTPIDISLTTTNNRGSDIFNTSARPFC